MLTGIGPSGADVLDSLSLDTTVSLPAAHSQTMNRNGEDKG